MSMRVSWGFVCSWQVLAEFLWMVVSKEDRGLMADLEWPRLAQPGEHLSSVDLIFDQVAWTYSVIKSVW